MGKGKWRHNDEVIPVLIGPTAVGKSSVSIMVAEGLVASGSLCELVNLDSMLVYRGMDIGTAKPSLAERARIRHHLVDTFDIDHSATVAEFQQLARAAIDDCQRRGVIPLLVGGSALYTRAVIDDFSFPGTDPEIRSQLEGELDAVGSAALHDRLRELDPDAAAEILPGNARRVVRALEVIMLTRDAYRANLPEHSHALADVVEFGLDAPRDWLDERIGRRVQQMWDDGFVDEVRRLEARGLRDARTASKALGYRQVLDFLAGEYDEAEAQRRTVTGTRRFARKQYGWYRRDRRITWLDARREDLVEVIVADLTGRLDSSQ